MDREYIKEKLLDGIEEKELLKVLTIRFYDDLYKEKRKQTFVKEAFEKFDSLSDAFNEILSNNDYKLIYHRVKDIKETLENIIIDYFNDTEEEIINTIIEETEISLSDIENDQNLFDDYDNYKEDITHNFFSKNPLKLYEEGKNYLINSDMITSLSEEDIIMELISFIDNEYVLQQISEKFADAIDNAKRYELVVDEEDNYEQGEGILMDKGKFNIDDYLHIYPFLYEYTGERVSYVATDTEDFSYWVTYEEFFKKFLRQMILSNFSTVLDKLSNTRQSEYIDLMDRLSIENDDHNDIQKILSQSQLIYNELNEIQDKIWLNFIEKDVKEIYNKGKKGS